MRIEMLLPVLSNLPVCIAAVMAMVIYKKADRALKLFCIYIIFSTIVLLTGLVLSLNHTNNMVLLHIYSPVGFALLSLFYKQLLKKAINKELLPVLALIFVVFSIVNSIFFQSVFTFNSNVLTVQSILIIILTLFTFLVSLNKSGISLVIKTNLNALGWINAGLLLYHTSTLLVLYLSNYIAKYYSFEFNVYIWYLNSAAFIIMYSCFIIGLWKQRKIYRS